MSLKIDYEILELSWHITLYHFFPEGNF
jgi:hypothetical protein